MEKQTIEANLGRIQLELEKLQARSQQLLQQKQEVMRELVLQETPQKPVVVKKSK